MADVSDVANALVALCTGVVYPNGVQTELQASVVGPPIRLYPGWPVKAQLDADMLAGVCHVNVYPRPQERNTTRYTPKFQQTSVNTATLTLTGVQQTVTVGGTIPPSSNPHNLAVFVNGVPYLYQPLTTDTLTTIAAALAALIPSATSAGAVITVPTSATLGAVRVGITGTSARPLRNQERVFQIGIWADTPAHRDVIAQAIDPVLELTKFILLPDGWYGEMNYRGSPETDQYEKSTLYRRDLMYAVDYATLQVMTTGQIVVVETDISAAVSGVSYAAVATEFT